MTRRILLTIATLAALAMLAAACGDTEQITASPADGAGSPVTAVQGDADDGDGPASDTPDVGQLSETEDPTDEREDEMGTPDELAFIGLSVDDAAALAEADARPWRIGRQDGEFLAVTDDYVVGRVTFEVDDGVVTAADVEAPLPEDPGPADEVSPTTVADSPATADLITDAVVRIVTEDNSFGGGMPFSVVYIGTALGSVEEGLEPLSLEMIAAALQDQVEIQFIVEAEDKITELRAAEAGAIGAGAAVVTVEDVRIEGDRAEIDVALWCGSLCGIWLTYEAKPSADGWDIIGTVGPIAVA